MAFKVAIMVTSMYLIVALCIGNAGLFVSSVTQHMNQMTNIPSFITNFLGVQISSSGKKKLKIHLEIFYPYVRDCHCKPVIKAKTALFHTTTKSYTG